QQKAGKGGKVVKKKPPTKGYAHWDRATFERLQLGEPEPLASRFQVSHAMLVNVLSRDTGGCAAMKAIVRTSHERPPERRRHARTAISMFRSLVEAHILDLVPGGVRVNQELQLNFSLNQTLSMYLIDTLPKLDRAAPGYAYDVLSLVEAILEDPDPILRKQLDHMKGELVAELKAQGVEYEERMAALEKLEYPKPNRDFVYATFNDFAERHPWVGGENIRPKGVARELYEQYLGFNEAVRHFELERAEHLLLRYVTETYKVLVQTVPEWALDDELDEMITYFHGMVTGVDSSLLDEWEKLRDPSYLPRRPDEPSADAAAEARPPDVTTDAAAFTKLVRNVVFRCVRALSCGDYASAAALVGAAPGDEPWTEKRLADALRPYYEDHGAIRTDPAARGTAHTQIDRSRPRVWHLRQVLVDPDEHDDWYLDLELDLDASAARGAPVLVLRHVGT
ncbi:MAG: DUF3516 domain-containing protein, partial [Polyangiaceae bacterium]|nr:DUF3516 domain-containing protein [Polyangiaceae bacterium]